MKSVSTSVVGVEIGSGYAASGILPCTQLDLATRRQLCPRPFPLPIEVAYLDEILQLRQIVGEENSSRVT